MLVFYDWTFPHVYFAKNAAYFPFDSWLSFQRLCRLYGDRLERRRYVEVEGRRLSLAQGGARGR